MNKKLKKRMLENKRVKKIMMLFEETIASDFDSSLEPGSKEYKKMQKKSRKDSVKRGDLKGSYFDPATLNGELPVKTKEALDGLESLLSGTASETTVLDVVNILNGDLNDGPGRWALQQGTENDTFEGVEDGGDQTVGSGLPSQSNIYISKSVAYAMCSAPTALLQIKNKSKEKGFLKINVMNTGEGFVVLDGHHRWSQQFTFGNKDTELDTRVFNFPGLDMEQTLARLQIGIAANTDAGKNVPAWYTDKKTGEDTRSPAGEDQSVDPKGSSDNLIGATSDTIIAKIHELLNKEGAKEIDKGIAHAENNGRFMGDAWTKELAKSSDFSSWLENKGALEEYKSNPVNFGDKAGSELIEDNKIICPLRQAIATQCASNLANTVCKKAVSTKAPDRDLMPQLDHEQALGKDGEERLLNQMKKGKINHSPAITADAEQALPESFKRWNKLAGTLLKS